VGRLAPRRPGEVGDHVEVHIFCERSLREPDPASFAAHILENGLAVPLD